MSGITEGLRTLGYRGEVEKDVLSITIREIRQLELDLDAANKKVELAIKHLENKRSRGKLSRCEDQVLLALTTPEGTKEMDVV